MGWGTVSVPLCLTSGKEAKDKLLREKVSPERMVRGSLANTEVPV